jgi:AraC-like DNA-binding protein
VSQECSIRVRFHQPPVPLRRYFTTFHLLDVTAAPGVVLADQLHPEWANLRFHSGSMPIAETQGGELLADTAFPVTGPSCQSVHFSLGATRMWGVGLLPLGWAKFIGEPADAFADRLVDGNAHPAFAGFASLAQTLFGALPDEAGELARITDYFVGRAGRPLADEARIQAIHGALVDPDIVTVAALIDRTGIGSRTVERICRRAFGFAPKSLLRRQRFMRSLAKFMLDPGLTWIGALDSHYHDQAQFVRDFRAFMGMTPRQYAALDHPILGAFMQERARHDRAAVQALDGPQGGMPQGTNG